MAENRRRLEHMENALHRMEGKIEDLRRRRNVLRQEEIVEEIEVILLSAESLLGAG
jgi:F-type H+-transporting ATPase subunit gamma